MKEDGTSILQAVKLAQLFAEMNKEVLSKYT
jgi:ribosome biogenesis protein Tsr3